MNTGVRWDVGVNCLLKPVAGGSNKLTECISGGVAEGWWGRCCTQSFTCGDDVTVSGTSHPVDPPHNPFRIGTIVLFHDKTSKQS